jgi:hypothetical protein
MAYEIPWASGSPCFLIYFQVVGVHDLAGISAATLYGKHSVSRRVNFADIGPPGSRYDGRGEVGRSFNAPLDDDDALGMLRALEAPDFDF